MITSFYTYDYREKPKHDCVAYFADKVVATEFLLAVTKAGFNAKLSPKAGDKHAWEVSIKHKLTGE